MEAVYRVQHEVEEIRWGSVVATEWFVRMAGGERGPISSEALKQLALEGQVTPESSVKKGNSGNWVPAGRVKGLFASTADQIGPPPMPQARPPMLKVTAAVPSSVTPPASGRSFSFDTFQIVLLSVGAACLLVLAISPFFNWVTIFAGGMSGIQGDGKSVAIISLVIGVLLAVELAVNKRAVTFVLLAQAWGTVAGLWMIGEILRVGAIAKAPEMRDNPFGQMFATQVGPGAGLFLGMISGIGLAVAFGILTFQYLKTRYVFAGTQTLSLVIGIGLAALLAGHESPSSAKKETFKRPFAQGPADLLGGSDGATAPRFGENDRPEPKKEDKTKAIEGLKKFVVNKARFYYSKDSFMEKPAIELNVTNKMPVPVSRAYFHAVLQTPGRSVPWVEEDFNYSIPGGLESGESATWELEPNMFGNWAHAPKDRNDMVLTVTPVRLDGSDGKPIYNAR